MKIGSTTVEYDSLFIVAKSLNRIKPNGIFSKHRPCDQFRPNLKTRQKSNGLNEAYMT